MEPRAAFSFGDRFSFPRLKTDFDKAADGFESTLPR
jgi:hypothetical protein